MKHLPIRSKLLVLSLCMSIPAVVFAVWIAFFTGKDYLKETAFNSLTAERVSKQKQIENYFESTRAKVRALSHSPLLIQAVKDFQKALTGIEAKSNEDNAPYPEEKLTSINTALTEYYENEFGPHYEAFYKEGASPLSLIPIEFASRYLQYQFIAENPNPIGEKSLFFTPSENTLYGRVHTELHPIISNLRDQLDIEDLYLIDRETGFILYTITKAPDFATNLIKGPFAGTALHRAFQSAQTDPDAQHIHLIDFGFYPPAPAAPSAFMTVPIMEGDTPVGILAIRLSPRNITKIISSQTSTDAPSESPFQSSILRHGKPFSARVAAPSPNLTAQMLDGTSGTLLTHTTHGLPLLISYAPLHIQDLDWTLISQTPAALALRPIREFWRYLILAGVCLIVFFSVLAWAFTASFVKPIEALFKTVRDLATKEPDLTLPAESQSPNEMESLTADFNQLVTHLQNQRSEIRNKDEENDRLLLNLLPAPIADRVKNGETNIADSFSEVTVLFADLVGFTKMAQGAPTNELFEFLNELFAEFDSLAQRHGVEKIKTIGDAYMAVAGVPHPRKDHAEAAASLALDMLETVKKFNRERKIPLHIRIGINSGPAAAGIIGTSKYIYDLWGETVNLASHMEAAALQDTIHVTESSYNALKEHFDLKIRDLLDMNGSGIIQTYFLEGRKPIIPIPSPSPIPIVRNSKKPLPPPEISRRPMTILEKHAEKRRAQNKKKHIAANN